MSYSLISLVDLSAKLSSGYFLSIHRKVLKRRDCVLTIVSSGSSPVHGVKAVFFSALINGNGYFSRLGLNTWPK